MILDRRSLTEFRFRDLFIDSLLWNNAAGVHVIQISEALYHLEEIAQKRGLVVLVCRPDAAAAFPGAAERKQIDSEVTKLHHEHVIIFVDGAHTKQIWRVPVRKDGKTVDASEITYSLLSANVRERRMWRNILGWPLS